MCENNLSNGSGTELRGSPELVFKKWLGLGLARQFNTKYNLIAASEDILPCWHGEVEDEENVLDADIDLQCDAAALPLLDALGEFKNDLPSSGSAKSQLEFKEFIGVLAGFVALPLVHSAWLKRSATHGSGPLFVDSPDLENLMLRGGLARAALLGGGLRLEFSGDDSDLPTPLGMAELMSKPSAGEVKSIEGTDLLAMLHAIYCAHTGVNAPKIWDANQLNTLRGRIRATQKKLGKGGVALALRIEQFDSRYNDWASAAHQALVKLNEGSAQDKEITLDVLIIQHRPSSLDVFHDPDTASIRMNLVKDILRLAL